MVNTVSHEVCRQSNKRYEYPFWATTYIEMVSPGLEGNLIPLQHNDQGQKFGDLALDAN
jgi:hypothetical protein